MDSQGPVIHDHRSRWISPPALIFLGIWIALLGVGRSRMLRDPGTFWHTVAGERMLQSGHLIREDPFSFSQAGQAWIPQQWLGELVMAAAHRACGLDGLLMPACALLAGVFTFLAARLLRAGLAGPWTAVLIALVMGASSYHFLPRPHLATLALMPLILALLGDVESGRTPAKRLLALPPVFVLWTNLHGGALGGVATVLMVVFGWLLFPLGRSECRPSRPLLGVVASLSIVAVLVNPFGAALPALWLGLMNSSALPQLIVEHAPLNLASVEGVMLLGLAAIYFSMLVCARRAGVRITWLIPAVWFILALTRVRHGPIFAMTAAVAIAEMEGFRLQTVGCRPRGQGGEAKRHEGTKARRLVPRARLALPALALALSVTFQATGVHAPLIGAGWARIDPDYWPTRTIEVLRDEVARRPDHPRVFNDMLFGGRLIYEAPRARVYIDDRCELYGDHGLRRYAEICRQPDLLEGLALYEGVEWALVARQSRIARLLAASPNWRQRAEDAVATLYRREQRIGIKGLRD